MIASLGITYDSSYWTPERVAVTVYCMHIAQLIVYAKTKHGATKESGSVDGSVSGQEEERSRAGRAKSWRRDQENPLVPTEALGRLAVCHRHPQPLLLFLDLWAHIRLS